MKKGVVLSVHKFSITLLTPDGEFDKSRRLQRNYQIGEEIYYKPVENSLKSFLNFSGSKTVVISAVVTCIMLVSIVIPQFSTQVSAYMTIDVNPSVELGLDDELKVVELRGINEDGKRVISQIHDWKNQDVSNIAEKIVLKTKELGYITGPTKEIIVSKTVLEQDKKLDKKLNQEIKGLTNEIDNMEVKLINATESDRNKAKQQGISTGKFVEQKRKEDESSLKKKNDNQGNGNITSSQNQKVNNNNQTNDHKYEKNHQKDKKSIIKNKGNSPEDKRKLGNEENWINKDYQKNGHNQKINRNADDNKENSRIKSNQKNRIENTEIKSNQKDKKENTEIKSNQKDKKENTEIKSNQKDKKENTEIKSNQKDKKENTEIKSNQKNKNEKNSKVKGKSGNNQKNSENKSNSRSKEESDNKRNSSNDDHSKDKDK